MSKRARSGAQQRLAAIGAEVTDMESAIARLARERDRLASFIRDNDALESTGRLAESSEEVVTGDAPVESSASEPIAKAAEPGKTSKKTGRAKRATGNSSKEEIVKAAVILLRAKGAPMGRAELYRGLIAEGLKIGGSNPHSILKTRVESAPDLIVSLPRGVYRLAESPAPTAEIGFAKKNSEPGDGQGDPNVS